MSTHERPEGVSDATVDAVGTLTKAYEDLVRIRGTLYAFHQDMGGLDRRLEEAADELHQAGHHEQANRLRQEIVGRNVIHGRWTFQIIEDFDDSYFSVVEGAERRVREELLEGRRHVRESQMKDERRSDGEFGHERRP